MTLVNQPTTQTARKVRASAWTAAWVAPISTLGAGIVTEVMFPQLGDFHMEIQLLMSMAVTGVSTWVVGYYTRERAANMLSADVS